MCSRNEPVYLPRLGHASIREPICGPASPVCFRARGSFPWAPKWALGDCPFRRLGALWVAGERWRRGDKLQRLCGLVLQVPVHIGCKMCCLVSPLGGLGGRMVARAWVDGCCGRRRVAHNAHGRATSGPAEQGGMEERGGRRLRRLSVALLCSLGPSKGEDAAAHMAPATRAPRSNQSQLSDLTSQAIGPRHAIHIIRPRVVSSPTRRVGLHPLRSSGSRKRQDRGHARRVVTARPLLRCLSRRTLRLASISF